MSNQLEIMYKTVSGDYGFFACIILLCCFCCCYCCDEDETEKEKEKKMKISSSTVQGKDWSEAKGNLIKYT